MRQRLVRGGRPVPASIERLVVRGLTKKPSDRFATAEEFLAEVEYALRTPDGGVTDVIRTKQGFVILKVVDHQMAGIPPFKEVLPRIQDQLYYQKLQPALRAYLTKLREEAYIKYADGYIDTGKSPNQTQPVETAAAKEIDAKKLSKKKHKRLGVL